MDTKNSAVLMPKFAKFFFENPKMVWFWTIVRIYVGWQWLTAGWEKIGDSVWNNGGVLTGFIGNALTQTTGAHINVQPWYGWFLSNVILSHPVFWAHIIAYGEFFVGLGLILGLFTILAAFFGWFMNLNYLLAGTVSTNPILLTLTLGIMLAGNLSKAWGLDTFVRPWFTKQGFDNEIGQ